MKNFFAFATLASLALLLSACDPAGESTLGSDAGTAGAVGGTGMAGIGGTAGSKSDGLPSSTITSDGTTYVGTVDVTIPWDTGSCSVPAIAKSAITATFSRSFIATSNVLACPSAYLSQFPDLKTLTCQEIVADVPAVAENFKKDSSTTMRVCCEIIANHLVANSYVNSGYFDTKGVACGSPSLIAGPLCSISGVFMGWACNGY